MDKNQMLQLFDSANQQLNDLSKTMAQLKIQVDKLQEENNKLRINNSELRDKIMPVLERTWQEEEKSSEAGTSKGLESLQNFYDEGIHVCHEFFGSRLLPDEECLFCQEVMKRLKN